MKINELVENLGDDFAAFLKDKNIKHRVRGTPEEERQRTNDMIAQRERDRANRPANVAAGLSSEERSHLEHKLAQLEREFDPNYQYSDDHSFWSKQKDIAQRIHSIKKRLSQGVAEAATDDPSFQRMMGNIQKSVPTPMTGYVAVSYASERPSKKIRGVTANGKEISSTTDDPNTLLKNVKFTSDQIEQKLIAIGRKHGWDRIDPAHGPGYDELYFDTSKEYTSNTQRQLAVNIVNTVREINKFFSGMNSSLQTTGLPGYKVDVWQGMGTNDNINQYEDLSQIAGIAKGQATKSKTQATKQDVGPEIGQTILKHLPSWEAEGDELGYSKEDFASAKAIAKTYITRGERAGFQAQYNADQTVSMMIDELLSDAGASVLRTIWEPDEDQGVAESASAGATSAANIGTVDAPQLSPGKARGKKSYTGSPGKSGTKAPPQPKVVQPKTKMGTAVNALDMKGKNIFGQAAESVVIKRR